MTSTEDFLHFTGMSYDASVSMSEKLVTDPNSKIYLHLRSALARRLAALKEVNDKKRRNGRRRRLVVSNTIEPEEVHKLTLDYQQYDLIFKQNDRVAAALAKSVVFLSVEKLFDFIRGAKGNVISYGFSLNHLVMHNRYWTHMCVARESTDVAHQAVVDDRAMCAVLNAARRKGKGLPMTESYASGDLSKICCSDPVGCTITGKVGLLALTHTDTNFYQVCTWMAQHGTDLTYLFFPCSKATEMRYNAEIPELGAYVMHEGEKFHILYKNASSYACTFTYKNHLTLIGKTYQVIGDYVFYKEFCGYQNGMAFYKVTRSRKQFPDELQVYRSWMNKGYQDRYLIKSFELKSQFGDLFDSQSYEPYEFEVPRSALDKLIEYTMGLDHDVFNHLSIARRLRSYVTTTVQAGYNIVNFGLKLSDKEFNHIVLAVYSFCFMKRFVSGVTMSFMTGQDKDMTYLRTRGALGLIPYALKVLVDNTIVMPVTKFFGWMRKLFDKFFGSKRAPVPTITLPQPFVEYSDSLYPTLWDQIKDWTSLVKPWQGFSPYLPGFPASQRARRTYEVQPAFLWAPEAVRVQNAIQEAMDTPVFDDASNVLTLVEPVEVQRGPLVVHESVQRLADKIMDGNDGHVDLVKTPLYMPKVFEPGRRFEDAHNGIVDDVLGVLPTVMGRIFPQSTLMQTDAVSGEIHNGDMDFMTRAVLIKVDASKLAPLRPERVFRPVMPNQVLPNAKQNLQSALPTVIKRNLNTVSAVEPMDINDLWLRTWEFMKIVYYVPDVEERLREMEPIMPTAEVAAVWASKLDEAARERALTTEFCFLELQSAMDTSAMMLKGKRKPNMGLSFDAAVKPSQSIQYDPTKSRTGVYSPLFAEKVRRDKSVLKDNVFIMQSKSPADMNLFLSAFSWFPKDGVPLKYIELDGEMFDKSQVFSTLMMHWNKCDKFGILPSYMEVLKAGTTFRSASSVQAGVKVFLTPQRGSGDSDTLDGNCDVSQAAYARWFSSFVDQIEFILIMGDDVTVAVRGDVDVSGVEADCMTEFNLSVKLTVSDFGYFVSGWLLNMPDGTIQWFTDPVKRALSFGDQSVGEFVDLHERYVGFKDICRGLDGYVVQSLAADAIVERYCRDLGHAVSRQDVLDMIKCVATAAGSFSVFSSFFAKELTKRSA